MIFWTVQTVLRPVWGYASGMFRSWVTSPYVPPGSGSVTNLIAASTNHIGLVASTPGQRTTPTDPYAP